MKKTLITSIINFMLISLLSSCAGISLEQMKQETANYQVPIKPKKNMAIVYVTRPSKIGGLIKFNVFLDDKAKDSEMGYNLGGQYVYFYVTPGRHKVLSKSENWSDVEIDSKANEYIFLKQSPRPGFIIARNKLSIITEAEGKFYIKNSTNGGIQRMEKTSLNDTVN